jgi:hypothetical protein
VVLAHELAHHVHGDIWKGIVFESLLILAGFYLAARVLAWLSPAVGLTGVADIAMGTDYRVGSGPGMGVLTVRFTDVNNYFVLETYLNTLTFYKLQGGTWVFLASQPLPTALVVGSTHRLEVRTLGPTLEGWWDGVRLLQVTDSFQQTATRHADWNSAYDTTTSYAISSLV